MRIALIVILAIVLIVGGVAAYLFLTAAGAPAVVRLPLQPSQRQLLAAVPATADSFALIPSAAAVQAKLLANPVTRDLVQEWVDKQPLPQSWMLGSADLLIWHSGKQTSYYLRLDPLRAFLARMYTMIRPLPDSERTQLLINAPSDVPIETAEMDRILSVGNGLPEGDALAVQLEESHGAFPPIGRPAVTTVRITATDLVISSRAGDRESRVASGESGDRESRVASGESGDAAAPSLGTRDSGLATPLAPLHPRFARSAILTAAFAAPPRAIEDMNRLVGAKASTLLRDGGAIALYDVDTGKLLPRPREVIVLPATPERRAALAEFAANAAPRELREAVGFRIETADTGSELVVAFERPSIDRYLKDAFDPPSLEANVWSIRIDPRRAVPMLEQIGDNPGLRFLAPRLFRSARNLRGWIERLEKARFIEAGDSANGGFEVLRVRVGS